MYLQIHKKTSLLLDSSSHIRIHIRIEWICFQYIYYVFAIFFHCIFYEIFSYIFSEFSQIVKLKIVLGLVFFLIKIREKNFANSQY